MEKLKMHSTNLTQDNIARIRDLFPGCVTEAKGEDGSVKLAVDFDQLRQELAESIVEGPQERYHLNWPGKREALLTANAPIAKTLRPCREEGVNFDSTKNLFIEGDNLEALKLLQETYLGKIKMIYIDPPYNTGNDYIYEDDFSESAREFLLRSNQKDEMGNHLVANTAANGRFHSDWLSMMYSRLRLARSLLRDDGLIFISIDDEIANLKKLCDEVFGEQNFIEIFSWQKTTTPSNLSKKTKKSCEYIIAYQKLNSGQLTGLSKRSKSSNGLMNQPNAIGVLIFPAGNTFTKLSDGIYQSGMYGTASYEIELLRDTEVKDGKFVRPVELRGRFKWSQRYLDEQIESGVKIYIQTSAFSPSYEKEEYAPEKPWNIINTDFGVGTNENAGDEVDLLFHKNFSEKLYPKPTSLLRYLINTNVGGDDCVLDFFAGSSTTAHAVMQLNAEDGGNRRFIMVQIPEACNGDSEAYKAGYETISEISKERIRRAGRNIIEGACHEGWSRDIGFRVLKIDTSSMADVYYASDALDKANLDLFVDNIKPDRTPEDLLFQVMLDWGVDLALPITRQSIQGKDVFFVDGNVLAACFDASGSIDEAFVKELAKQQPLRVVFRDAGYKNSAVKINVEQIFKLLSPATEVKCI